QLTALTIGQCRVIQVNHRWIDKEHAARCAEDADQVFDLILCQAGVSSLACITTGQCATRIADRDRRARCHLQNGSDLPATNQTIKPTNIIEEALPSTERKFVDGIEIEYVRSVVVGA